MTCIAIIHHPSGSILPIVNADGETMATYLDRAAAETAMQDTMAAVAWGYDIIDLDEI